MSIETERWFARERDVVSTDGATVARCIDEPEAQAIAVLPEALALLKRIQDWDERSRECPEAAGRCPLPEIAAILRRAGVLP